MMSVKSEMRIYYAHSMKIYNTDREQSELSFIENIFSEVCNPNTDLIWEGSMRPYFDEVRRSEAVVFSEYQGHVGRGVHDEINIALDNNIPVYCIRWESGNPVLFKLKSVDKFDEEDWAINYGIVEVEPFDMLELNRDKRLTMIDID